MIVFQCPSPTLTHHHVHHSIWFMTDCISIIQLLADWVKWTLNSEHWTEQTTWVRLHYSLHYRQTHGASDADQFSNWLIQSFFSFTQTHHSLITGFHSVSTNCWISHCPCHHSSAIMIDSTTEYWQVQNKRAVMSDGVEVNFDSESEWVWMIGSLITVSQYH